MSPRPHHPTRRSRRSPSDVALRRALEIWNLTGVVPVAHIVADDFDEMDMRDSDASNADRAA
jgi:hypothetical protein